MRLSLRARFLLGAFLAFFSAGWYPSGARGPQQPQFEQFASRSALATPSASQASPGKNPPLGPAPPQSSHFPILLLVVGKDLSWSLRIGQKGPERMDRVGYPPIPLDPGDVTREGPDIWTYKGTDAETGAAVAVHLTRGNCTDNTSPTKYGFTASVEHAQIGSLEGCARVATELFPRINNQPTEEDDDTPAKPAPPTVTHFQSPTAVAYITGAGKMIVKRGSITRIIAGIAGHDLCLSHDGKRLLFVRDEQPAPLRTINEFDFETRRLTELIRADVNAPFWSTDDSRIAFLENVGGKRQVWMMPADDPAKAAPLYPGDEVSLYGWVDGHTVLASDLQNLAWIGDDGTLKQTIPAADVYGKDQFSVTSGNAVRIHPRNPDLLLVSAELEPTAAAAATKEAARKQAADQAAAGKSVANAKAVTFLAGPAFFEYEVRSKRRVLLSPPNMLSNEAEWSGDGLQIFFTGRDARGQAAIYRVFWDGTSLVKIHDGSDYVIGQ